MSELCKDISVSFAAATLLSERDWLILTHQYPDGDTLGSAYALCRALQRTGRKARVICADPIPEKYAYLTSAAQADEVSEAHIVAVDVADSKLLGAEFNAAYGKRIDLCIDHHHSNIRYASRLLLQDCSAAAMPVSKVIAAMGVSLDPVIAEALYTAISTDTGCFRYANTTGDTFAAAAACAKAGAEVFSINQALFETNSLARLKVQAYLLENAIFLQNGQIAVCPLPKAAEAECGACEDDLENISGFPRTIEGVKLAVTIREEGTGRVKMSVRAVPGQDAAALCAKFGGGGHKGAAGASMNKSMDEAINAIIAELPIL